MKVRIFHKKAFQILVTLAISFTLLISISNVRVKKGIEEGINLESFINHLDSQIPIYMNDYDIPGVNIALIKEGKIAWKEAYGYADQTTGRKMTIDTYMRVQSISKPVTAWGVMKLVQEDKIDLDTPVVQYLKNWDFPESDYLPEKITVRQLLSHTAGLPLGDVFTIYSPNEKRPSLKEALTKEAYLIQEPGLSFFYSNTGFNLLELLIEEVTGQTFDEYMTQEILKPLGMNHSTFTWSEQLEPQVPVGYNLAGEAIPVYVYPEKGSGGLFATAEDIATFVTAGMIGDFQEYRVLEPQYINQLYTPAAEKIGVYSLVFDSYGFGHYLERFPSGEKAISHGGQGTGIMTHFHAVPETKDGIVILTNSQRSWPFIAYILSDWAKWNGFSHVGMSRIIWGEYVQWALIGSIWFIALLQLWRLIEGVIFKRLEFKPLSKKNSLLRFIQGSMSFVLIAVLLWCVNQKYLFITSVFPITSIWLGISLLLVAIVLILTALFPKKDLVVK